MSKNIYTYDGKEFYSLKSLAEYAQKNEKTLTARLRRGIPIDQACNAADLRCSYYENEGIQKSVAQICRDQKKDEGLIRNRLKYGYSLHDALNKPKKIAKQGKPIVVNGIRYNSIAEAIRKLDKTDKASTIRRKLRLGMKPDQAFRFEEDN